MTEINFDLLRKQMVKQQLIGRGIADPDVLEAFKSVPRHKFVPTQHIDLAYDDYPIPIGAGQTISQPYMVALMTELLKLRKGDKVLEIGLGSGYQAAILCLLGSKVYSVERIAALASTAKENLKSAGFEDVNIKVADGTLGWQEFAPFDRIIVTAASYEVPPPLIDQLAFGGRLVIPLGSSFSQVLTIFEKQKDTVKKEEFCGCVFVPLMGKYGMIKQYG